MRHALLLSCLLAACGGDRTNPTTVPVPGPTPDAAPPITPDAAPISPPPVARQHRDPEVFLPPWKKVGVGQTIHFGVAAIDQDLDEVAVTVSAMPASARFDAYTQTVSWTPTKADLPAGKFQLTVTQRERGADGTETQRLVPFEIEVTKARQPVPVAEQLGLVPEALLTIREPARLASVNKEWPLDKMLVKAAELKRVVFSPEVQAKLAPPDAALLYRDVLTELARTHDQPRLDPASAQFDPAFAKPGNWQIVTFRPRIDKDWTELRVVYRNVLVAEPTFVMFRLRTVLDIPNLPPEAKGLNNTSFLGLVAKHLLDAKGAVKASFARDAKAHGKALAAFLGELVAFRPAVAAGAPPPPSWHRAAFFALPTEARLGGGSKRGPDGSYASGDGWAWSVLKPMPTADGTRQAYTSMPIPGFWTQAVPSPDGTTWAPRCAPKFNPDDPARVPGYEVLCRKPLGFVDQPELVAGKVTAAKRDANNLFLEHKLVDSVALLPLDDGRRDLGEENGMTCAQCHMRNFGTRDRSNLGNVDPRAGAPSRNAPIATLNFQIVPDATWEAYTLAFMDDQQCRGHAQLERWLGLTGLGCPPQR